MDSRTHRHIENILSHWRSWPLPLQAKPEFLRLIPGGLTNTNVKISAPGLPHPLLLRLNNPYSQQLGINRQHEAQIVHTLANAGITPAPLYRDSSYTFTLTAFINARTWNNNDLATPVQCQRLQQLLTKIHTLNPATPRRSYLAYLQHYWQQLQQHKAISTTTHNRWQKFLPHLQAFDCANWSAQLTHHDLVPGNILDTGSKLYLIDWEYAALGNAEIDQWCINPAKVQNAFIHELAEWTNALWEKVIALQPKHL